MVLQGSRLIMLSAVMCLALNLYFEARDQPVVGQLAVGFSTMNRVADERYPDTVCGVVKQAKYNSWDSDHPIRHRCQYSWFCDGLSDLPTDDKAMLEATILAANIFYGRVTDISAGSTHYHATYVQPYWADHMTVVFTIDDHIFYR
jgi:spore germination cell wall hydrolase CwlJ-like protein